MSKVIIGVDPHKLSATIEVIDERETILGSGRFSTDKPGFAAMRSYARQWSEAVWAVEGSLGVGRPLAQRLLAAGERVVDVPAKLAARARLLDTGHGRKTDAHDAHSVAVAAVRARELRVLAPDGELEALRMLVDHRDQLSNQRVAALNRLQALLAELTPGKAKKDITTLQAKEILSHVRPRDAVGKTRRRIAAEEVANLAVLDKRIKLLVREIKGQIKERGSNLMDIPGVGPIVAGRILADVGDVSRFADRNRFASWTGTAPLDASSGEQTRHRLSRAGNRRMNRALHIAATTQIRLDTEGRAYYRRKIASGKSHLEAMRCLKRRLSDVIYRQLIEDERARATGPGGQRGASVNSCATDSHPHIGTSDQPLPGPAQPTLRPAAKNRNKSTPTALPAAS